MECKLLNLSIEKENFVVFLSSDYCSKIMRENKFLIHIESGKFILINSTPTKVSMIFYLHSKTLKKKQMVTLAMGVTFQDI